MSESLDEPLDDFEESFDEFDESPDPLDEPEDSEELLEPVPDSPWPEARAGVPSNPASRMAKAIAMIGC